MSAAKEYLLLERLLLTARSEGSLRPEAETGLVDRMELLWLSMTDNETAEADARALRFIEACRASESGSPRIEELREDEGDAP